MRAEVIVFLLLVVSLSSGILLAAAARGSKAGDTSFDVRPIGKVQIRNGETAIVIDPRYADGLDGLGQFSHVWVFYWFDRNDMPAKRRILKVHPRGNSNNPLTGVFATRSPVRPNLIALTLCKIRSVSGNHVLIDKIDALPGSPVIDLKPYIPGCDCRPDATVPAWVNR
jgi:tRNA (adenine37-N6)-methyltransferase